MVTEENLAEGRLYPPLSTIREVSFKIAVKVGDVTCTRSLRQMYYSSVSHAHRALILVLYMKTLDQARDRASFCFPLRQLVNYAYKHNIASVYPEPKDKEAFVLSHIYSPDYDSFTLDTYSWPQEAMNVQDV